MPKLIPVKRPSSLSLLPMPVDSSLAFDHVTDIAAGGLGGWSWRDGGNFNVEGRDDSEYLSTGHMYCFMACMEPAFHSLKLHLVVTTHPNSGD